MLPSPALPRPHLLPRLEEFPQPMSLTTTFRFNT